MVVCVCGVKGVGGTVLCCGVHKTSTILHPSCIHAEAIWNVVCVGRHAFEYPYSPYMQTAYTVQGDTLETRASLLQMNLNFGDPCTFSIISRNVTNLLPKSQGALKVRVYSVFCVVFERNIDPSLSQERTEAELDALISSFQLLDLHVDKLRLSPENDAMRTQAQRTLAATIDRTVAFERAIQDCLGV